MPPTDLTSPLRLHPVLVEKPWGGHRLHELGRHDDPTTRIGESWDVADLPTDATAVADPVSRVVGGPHDGATLSELITGHAEALLGTATTSSEGRFPLLVKTLDAAETLSVQVHPPRSLAPDRTKTESWVVLDAADDAQLLLGVRDGVTLDDVRAAAGSPEVVDLLAAVPAHPGDVVHVPAGTIHALGAGVLVAEVQTPSDITHRLWDWPEARGDGRQLHVAAALEAIAAGWEHNLDVRPSPPSDGVLVHTDAYTLHRTTLGAGQARSVADGTARVVIVLDGTIGWEEDDGRHHLARTGTVVLPAACSTPLVAGDGGATLLVAVPSS